MATSRDIVPAELIVRHFCDIFWRGAQHSCGIFGMTTAPPKHGQITLTVLNWHGSTSGLRVILSRKLSPICNPQRKHLTREFGKILTSPFLAKNMDSNNRSEQAAQWSPWRRGRQRRQPAVPSGTQSPVSMRHTDTIWAEGCPWGKSTILLQWRWLEPGPRSPAYSEHGQRVSTSEWKPDPGAPPMELQCDIEDRQTC
jgi:hypothetical protein